MSRVIKFRAWDGERMVHWPNWAVTFTGQLLEENGDEGFTYRVGTARPPLMQYTGLKDKNGREIYEGDIIRFTFKTGIVTQVSHWDEVFYGWRLGGFHYTTEELKCAEVIGTVYENPELITE
ncbi:phage uncharacterized protein TIGR01671 [Arthrobacter sp. ok909]|uniref:YopX family protein n=1 Tax=Arthrobacter sp. ok909 TaxID=1761746 RepID=UPI00088EABF0|nr:YopX family protein [Arthrobacter sp. ok909]SDP33597.1 phage uncharacterized protein TIGR01671 [Arthrobacter sp. ok909]